MTEWENTIGVAWMPVVDQQGLYSLVTFDVHFIHGGGCFTAQMDLSLFNVIFNEYFNGAPLVPLRFNLWLCDVQTKNGPGGARQAAFMAMR